MSELIARLRALVRTQPDAPAIRDARLTLTRAALLDEIDRLARELDGTRIGLLLDNGAHWACLDLALQARGAACVPLPAFFSDAQLRHVLRDAGIDTLVSDDHLRSTALLPEAAHGSITVAGQQLCLLRQAVPTRPALPPGTAKITYTSGTTGTPKGVCLSQALLDTMTAALASAVNADARERALSLLPLSLLLENIGGLYAPLHAGALAQLPPLAACGLSGAAGFDARRCFEALATYAPTTTILVPQLLKGLVAGIHAGCAPPASLRFVAVGGAPVAPALLDDARRCGVPAWQGYGLSEAGSVVSLNVPGAERAGSVGKPLPNVDVTIADDGEVIVSGRLFLGYLGQDAPAPQAWRTGDRGHIDADGFLFIEGRAATSYSTAFGRNVAPEWVESTLLAQPRLLQAAVFGAARPHNVAVLVPAAGTTRAQVQAAVDAGNATLPDYARVTRWIAADTPFAAANGLARGNGVPDRAAIAAHYHNRIETLYASEEDHVAV